VAVDKDGLRTNVKADALSSIASIDDYDLEVRKQLSLRPRGLELRTRTPPRLQAPRVSSHTDESIGEKEKPVTV
jgi:hypothetical protein